MDSFQIIITVDRRRYRMTVTQVYHSPRLERYELAAGGKKLIMQTNRPVIEKRGLKHFPYTWKLIEGTISHKSYQDDIIKHWRRICAA